jgi:hypothetical protein
MSNGGRGLMERYVLFLDDNLMGYRRAARRRAKAIFQGMIDRKIKKKWGCQTPINFGDDECRARPHAARLSFRPPT